MDSDLFIRSMERIAEFNSRIARRRAVATAFRRMRSEVRLEMIAQALGVMHHADSNFIIRIDPSRPWGLDNIEWGRRPRKIAAKHSRGPLWSPTAQCPKCTSHRTTTLSCYRRGGTRSHKCQKCEFRFRTAMAELQTPSPRKHLTEIAAECGISARVISARLALGWTWERAISQPVQKRNGTKQ